jgi:hypothetical protein
VSDDDVHHVRRDERQQPHRGVLAEEREHGERDPAPVGMTDVAENMDGCSPR